MIIMYLGNDLKCQNNFVHKSMIEQWDTGNYFACLLIMHRYTSDYTLEKINSNMLSEKLKVTFSIWTVEFYALVFDRAIFHSPLKQISRLFRINRNS